jgi:hypothetical protein
MPGYKQIYEQRARSVQGRAKDRKMQALHTKPILILWIALAHLRRLLSLLQRTKPLTDDPSDSGFGGVGNNRICRLYLNGTFQPIRTTT